MSHSATPARTRTLTNIATAPSTTGEIDMQFLTSLAGYQARRASLALLGVFAQAVQGYEVKVVEFSMLSLIQANPGITNAQLCGALGLLPPNAVGLVNTLLRQGWITKQPHPSDRRAAGLHATEAGQTLVEQLQARIVDAERAHLSRLTPKEQRQLIMLLEKTYLP